jgi:septation ring formation regulator EzrA
MMDEAFEKRLGDVEESVKTIAQFVRNEVDNLKKINEELSVLQASTEKINTENHMLMKRFHEKINSIENMEQKMAEIGITKGTDESVGGSFDKELQDTKDMVDGMKMTIASLGKHIHDVEKELTEIKEKKTEHREKVNTKEISGMVSKLVVKNFEEFAKVMDRKIPHLMTRDEHVRHMEELSKKINSIQAPDLSGLARRIDMVEQKLEEISAFIQGVYNKMPVVVE